MFKAEEIRLKLRKLQKDYLMDLEDEVVAVKDDKGKVKLHQAISLTEAGTVTGFCGMLIGLMWGAAAGAVSGAGADMVFVEAVQTPEEMRKVNEALAETGTPSLANMVEGGRTPILSAKDLQELGYSVAAYPCGSVFAAVKALQNWAHHLKACGSSIGYLDHMLSFGEYFEFIGAGAIREREKEFV
jgi:hypothetical protein